MCSRGCGAWRSRSGKASMSGKTWLPLLAMPGAPAPNVSNSCAPSNQAKRANRPPVGVSEESVTALADASPVCESRVELGHEELEEGVCPRVREGGQVGVGLLLRDGAAGSCVGEGSGRLLGDRLTWGTRSRLRNCAQSAASGPA